ncbi:MAG: hypothetical protein SGJ24_19660 [Chloroflexota bacterium]|nr:hypothetical protein [Chloroflexota bacterium]
MDDLIDLEPDDGMLIGVINHPRDLVFARAGWYRVPVARYRQDLSTQAVAVMGFFLSRKFGTQNGGVAYYARKRGVELATRRELIPSEPDHARADERYYRVALGALIARTPPITNPTRRTIAFIHTTWGRFAAAAIIADLYRAG